MKLIILLCSLLIVGCSDTVIQEVYINTTVEINNTIYKDVPVIEYVDRVIECAPIECVQEFDPSYVSNLLRDVNVCQRERDLLNGTDLLSDYHNLNISLHRCENRLEAIDKIIEG